jgi:predicted DNA-binding protein with PD1-like motif
VEAATLQVIGGLEQAVVGYFDPERAEYLPTRTGHVEICSGLGNVSVRDGQPFIHLHLVLSGPDGSALGGHAMEGCRAYVVEAYFRKLDGPAPIRQEVEGMALKVWPGR